LKPSQELSHVDNLSEIEDPMRNGATDQPHVLLVDDDPINRSIARATLEKQGFQVSEAADGVAALEHIQEGTPFSPVLMDLSMPRLDGRELLKKLRTSGAGFDIPVIVLTRSQD